MANIVITEEVVKKILSVEIPKLFSAEGNKKYVTEDPSFEYIEEDGEESYDISCMRVVLRVRE